MKYLLAVVSLVSLLNQNADSFSIPAGAMQKRQLQRHGVNVAFNGVEKKKASVQTCMSADKNEGKEIKVGVIGCGRIGVVHLGAITKAPNVTPVIVSNPTVSKAEAGRYCKSNVF
jgi:hypothetical protein